MVFDPHNPIVQLCASGMNLDGEGKPEEAAQKFNMAWEMASDDFEKMVAAHYVARHQKTVADKLRWDVIALDYALKMQSDTAGGAFPSLYLNVGKGYEDLKDWVRADKHYRLALLYIGFLSDDGYGKMIRSGVLSGLERIKRNQGRTDSQEIFRCTNI